MSDTTGRKQKNVIIIDDNASIRDLIMSLLKDIKRLDYIDTACSAAEAKKQLRARQYDLVICDWNMPQTTGLDLLIDLKANEMTKSIPFLMVTGEVRKEYILEAIQHGVSDYISKPFQGDLLIKKVCHYLKIPCPDT